jgi:hypothetical protein
MRATSERKRRQRANRHRDPLDQLHGTSLRAQGEGPRTKRCGTPSLTNPLLGGHRRSLSGVPLMTHKPDLSPTAHAVVAPGSRLEAPHQIGWFPGR